MKVNISNLRKQGTKNQGNRTSFLAKTLLNSYRRLHKRMIFYLECVIPYLYSGFLNFVILVCDKRPTFAILSMYILCLMDRIFF